MMMYDTMPIRLPTSLVLALTAAGLTSCGSDPAEEPREQIIVAERGDAAAPAPAANAAKETASESD